MDLFGDLINCFAAAALPSAATSPASEAAFRVLEAAANAKRQVKQKDAEPRKCRKDYCEARDGPQVLVRIDRDVAKAGLFDQCQLLREVGQLVPLNNFWAWRKGPDPTRAG